MAKKGRRTLYDPERHPLWAESLAKEGCTEREIAITMGISQTTLTTWKNEYPLFLTALKNGKGPADAEVEKALFKSACGYDVTEKKIVINSATGKPERIETTVKHMAPNATSAIFWLKNRKPEVWRDVRRNELTGTNGKPIEHAEVYDLSNLSSDEILELTREAYKEGDAPCESA